MSEPEGRGGAALRPVSGAARWLGRLRPTAARERVPGSAARSGRVRAAMARGRVSGRWRVVHLLWETSPGLAVALAAFALADGVLPNLAWVGLGASTGRIPAAVTDGLGSAAGRALLVSLAVGAGAYALSLMRTPAEDLLEAYGSAVMATGMQRRLARAVCTPAGIEHLEDPGVLDQLSSASGELTSTRPADAPMTLASAIGDRLGGLGACVVLATFRWWLGLLFLAGWLVIRPPLRRLLAERALLTRRATPALRHSWYYLGCAWRPQFAKEMRVFGLGEWILGRYQERWTDGMAPSWAAMSRLNRRVLAFGGLVAVMYGAGAGALGLAAYRQEIGLGTLAVMLPMMAMTMQVGGVSAADVMLEQMLAAVPDLDDIIGRLGGPATAGPAMAGPEAGEQAAAGLPARSIRLESVSYRYACGDHAVLDELDLELPSGQSTALVGLNGAGKTTLVTLLARLRDPTGGRILVDGTDLRDLDARGWQRQVAVVYQDFTRYPLSARENVALRDLGAGSDDDSIDNSGIDGAALERAAEQSGAAAVVAGLPRGWDTLLSSGYHGGVDLSGGQWQRIALARALYSVARGARVLILDEPTAQLDIKAEAAFYNRFLELTAGVTTLIISHRFATVRRADRIAVLDGGRITELGSHDDLVAADGTYAEMFTLQAARFAAAGPAPEGSSRG
ncbi:MAG: ABC transporter ATP-binding protein [Streptosporangiaceae bacterium]